MINIDITALNRSFDDLKYSHLLNLIVRNYKMIQNDTIDYLIKSNGYRKMNSSRNPGIQLLTFGIDEFY